MKLCEVFCWDRASEETGRLCFYVPVLVDEEEKAIERAMAMHPSFQKRQSDGEQFHFVVRAFDSVLEEEKQEPEPESIEHKPPPPGIFPKGRRGRPRKNRN